MEIAIPPNTTATVYVPARDAAQVTESGQRASEAPGIKLLRHENGAAAYAIGSGSYRFESPEILERMGRTSTADMYIPLNWMRVDLAAAGTPLKRGVVRAPTNLRSSSSQCRPSIRRSVLAEGGVEGFLQFVAGR